jgi:hypothetical protein
MWVSGRQAAVLLAGVLPTREHALFVRALADRPPVTAEELPQTCPGGLYVARLRRETRVDVGTPWRTCADAVATQPRMPGLTAALFGVRMRATGGLPWAATLCGFVVLCAQARGFGDADSDTVRFDLAPPGPWATSFERRRLATRPGRPWLLLEPDRPDLSGRARR